MKNFHCYDLLCPNSPQHQLLGLGACTAHYIEALEHFAHLAEEKFRRLMAADASTSDSHVMAKALSRGLRGFRKGSEK